MVETAREEAALLAEQRRGLEGASDGAIKDRRREINKKKLENTLNLLKNLGDTVTASQALSLPKKLFGFDFNDGQVGFGGLLSAVITCYQLYPAKK
jgi:hypothetical protein